MCKVESKLGYTFAKSCARRSDLAEFLCPPPKHVGLSPLAQLAQAGALPMGKRGTLYVARPFAEVALNLKS